ncbi:GSCFA domain-containing protein [Salegentibacter salinarum]|uniref:GSCFA domain-containing protein n=1 Tax=Salegentibacter salinarum TaxID=447422 RepID=A0A2N0U2F0_9FLAO|nr:GSCFA domain-containing protein [Salegentibacter salinarum]PKD21068.1 GSCFA domain-containing protein [Salegentibacter salinarum]SKB75447.1 GSCFA family protein [Salegentibacter salinarum]
MEFRTKIPIRPAESKIDYESKLFLIGSCFVENICKKLTFYKLEHLQNPFGILFHPLAIAKFFQKITENYTYTEKDIFQYQERWHCFDAHSFLSNPNAEVLLNNLNSALQDARECLQQSSHVVITLGTAWSYFHLETEQSVANCHKIPQKFFRKELKSVEEIQCALLLVLKDLKLLNPELEVIFTLSPVRHIKDGFIENQRSKAHIITAVQQICEENRNTHYFPSYELMMDELRDYRFYAEDMLHPSQPAIDYIWQRFTETWFSEASFSTLKEVENIQKGLEHRPFNPDSEAHRRFLKNLDAKASSLKKHYPHIQF